ncbi:hypothetical protein CQ034_12115 [Microbacterium sp. MYb45]|nr:hypothetical protein CQ034_12115 [Microbacterium sp. MYb45]
MSHRSWKASGEVAMSSRYQVECHSSIARGVRSSGCSHEQSPEIGWFTLSTPPRRSTSSTHSCAGRRKSIQPMSPKAFA